MEMSAPLVRRLLFVIGCLLIIGVWAAMKSSAATSHVDIRDFSFQPADITVHQGDTVTWTNRDSEAHAVQGGPMNSPDIQPGGEYSATFTQIGDVSYICRIHTYMSGVVHVVGEGTPTSSTTTATTAPSTTSTSGAPGATSSSTTSTSAPHHDGADFQDVPDDPSATAPPNSPDATAPPPHGPASTTTTASTQPSSAPPPQDVPDDPGDDTPPGDAASGDAGTDLQDGTFLAPYSVDDGVKVFHLTMAPTTIEVAPGVTKDAYAFNGIVPGPVLRVDEGDRLRIIVKNDLPFATGVHWHGMILPNDQDGVPGITQPFIQPGETYTYEWKAIATGTHWYHSHSSGRHIGKGLYGALEVVPKNGDFAADRDYRLLLGDTDLGFVLNGRQFPSTHTLVAKVGETVRVRLVNAGDQVHAMHLHGTPFDVVAQDGNPLASPMKIDTLTISPGQTYDLLASEPNPGKWLLHCHIFAHSHMSSDEHMDGDSGMTGMVTILDVAPSDASVPDSPLPISRTRDAGSRGIDPSDPWLVFAAVLVLITALRAPTLPNRKDMKR